jgi:hypothetical protein
MRDPQGAFGFVDGREEIVVLGSDAGGCQFGDALRVTLGSLRHHGQFGGHGGEIVGGHRVTIFGSGPRTPSVT